MSWHTHLECDVCVAYNCEPCTDPQLEVGLRDLRAHAKEHEHYERPPLGGS